MSEIRIMTFKMPTADTQGHLNGKPVKLVHLGDRDIAVYAESGEVCEPLTEALGFKNELTPDDVAMFVAKLNPVSLQIIHAAGNTPEEQLYLELAVEFLNRRAHEEQLLKRLIPRRH